MDSSKGTSHFESRHIRDAGSISIGLKPCEFNEMITSDISLIIAKDHYGDEHR